MSRHPIADAAVEAATGRAQTAVQPLAYSLADAGKALGGVSVPTLHRWVRAGKMRTSKVGGRTFVRRAELERLLKEGETESRAA